MTNVSEIPFTDGPQEISVPLGELQYRLRLSWSEAARDHEVLLFQGGGREEATGWHLDIVGSDGAPLVSGIPLVAGVDLLAPYAYLGIPGSLYCGSSDRWTRPPMFGDLGGLSRVYFTTE
jgi:hypothetical protein